MSQAPRKPHAQQGYENKPFENTVTRVNPTQEKLHVDSTGGTDEVRVAHPMLGVNAWFRALPDKGANVITQSMAGTIRRAHVGYLSRTAVEYIRRYNAGVGVYKQLEEGEWDAMTPGVAHLYGTSNGKLWLRGGAVYSCLDSRRLHSLTRAPTHLRQLHQNLHNEVEDEERFGVVQRNLTASTKWRWVKVPITSTTSETDSRGNTKTTSFAKEYLRIFGRDGQRLAAYQEGDCFDDTGNQLKQDNTGRNLRAYREYYDATGNIASQWKLDEQGDELWNTLAERLDIVADEAVLNAALKQMIVRLSDLCDIRSDSNIGVLADTLAHFGGQQSTIVGPDTAPIDSAVKGTTFVSNILGPLLTMVASAFSTIGNDPTMMAHSASYYACKIAGVSIAALAALIPNILSTNVRISH